MTHQFQVLILFRNFISLQTFISQKISMLLLLCLQDSKSLLKDNRTKIRPDFGHQWNMLTYNINNHYSFIQNVKYLNLHKKTEGQNLWNISRNLLKNSYPPLLSFSYQSTVKNIAWNVWGITAVLSEKDLKHRYELNI